MLPDADLLIAAIAMTYGYILVTKDLGFKTFRSSWLKEVMVVGVWLEPLAVVNSTR